jgi:hypothetical protein
VTAVYDAGALIAADGSDREMWADHRARLELDEVPLTTAPVVAQASRSGRQAQLRRFLRGCEVAPLAAEDAHAVGALAGKSGVSDVVDVHLVVLAHRAGAGVVTADEDDLLPIVSVLRTPPPIFPI